MASRLSRVLTRTNLVGVLVVAAVLALGIIMQQSTTAPNSSPANVAQGERTDAADSSAEPADSQPSDADTGTRPTPRPIPVTAELSAGFYVRAGSFSKDSEALEQAKQLQGYGYSPWVVSGRRWPRLWRTSYEVRMGPYSRAELAEDRKQRLQRLGFGNLSVVEERPSR